MISEIKTMVEEQLISDLKDGTLFVDGNGNTFLRIKEDMSLEDNKKYICFCVHGNKINDWQHFYGNEKVALFFKEVIIKNKF